MKPELNSTFPLLLRCYTYPLIQPTGIVGLLKILKFKNFYTHTQGWEKYSKNFIKILNTKYINSHRI